MYDLMKKILWAGFCLLTMQGRGQQVSNRLARMFESFVKDSQLQNALASLYVIDGKTGAVVFDRNSQTGLAPASTQKIITTVTAYELLGKDFRYKTEFGYSGSIRDSLLEGEFYILPSGDPTLGSWRWRSTSDTVLLRLWLAAAQRLPILSYGGIRIQEDGWDDERVPDGWIWQDIGNYYGAGVAGFNWHENQYDIVLESGTETGSAVRVAATRPEGFADSLYSLVKAAAKGSGDNAYVYYPLQQESGVIRGTIPIGEKSFVISASQPRPAVAFTRLFSQQIRLKKRVEPGVRRHGERTVLHTQYSPPLDSIIYWLNKKSINLYGEALLKTIAYQQGGLGSTGKGAELVTAFWKERNLPSTELHLVDGSGLSPLNRVTTHAQVTILYYAKKQSWFSGFYRSLPEYNGMKMKSGTIHGVKGFCGYHTAANGKEYIFSFLVNNYNGPALGLVNKMYRVLDQLK
jgi:D-alanyl-D-alanine carboxypeptidase/D-alanyl-D-alanine-endopeptidase (penicillin-binding protein 4)